MHHHQMAIEFFLAAIEQFLPLAEQAVGHGGEGLFVFQVVFEPGAEGAFADVVREAAVFLAGLAVEQALHLFVQGFVIATGLLLSLAGNKAGGLARLVLAGEGGAQVFDGHFVQLLWLIRVAGDFAMDWCGIHCSFPVVGRVVGWWFIFLWKNNSLRSDIFFRQKNKPPPRDRQTIGVKSVLSGTAEDIGLLVVNNDIGAGR